MLHRFASKVQQGQYYWLLGLALLMGMGGCRAFQTVDSPATLQAQNNAYATEAVSIQQTAAQERTQVLETAVAAVTQAAGIDNINQRLLATVQVVIPPTPGVIAAVAPDGSTGAGMMEGEALVSSSGAQFIEVALTDRLRPSDGCPEVFLTQFTPDAERIYVSTRAVTVFAGTVMSVDWMYEGQIVLQDSWVVETDAQNYCLWYYISPEDIAFSPGSWSVRLYANSQPIEPIISFTIAPA